jgi:hypothetical protein
LPWSSNDPTESEIVAGLIVSVVLGGLEGARDGGLARVSPAL